MSRDTGAPALTLTQPRFWRTALIDISVPAAKINEDNFGPEDDEIQFDDCGYGDDDDVDEVSPFDYSCRLPLMSERNESASRSQLTVCSPPQASAFCFSRSKDL